MNWSKIYHVLRVRNYSPGQIAAERYNGRLAPNDVDRVSSADMICL